MTPRARLAALLLAAAALLGTTVFLGRNGPAAPLGTSSAFVPTAFPEGTVLTYDVDWRTHSAAAIGIEGQPAVESDVAVKGTLALRSYGPKDGALLLGVRWENVETARIEALGRVVMPADDARAELLAADALVGFAADGHVRELRFSEQTSPLVRGLVRALVLELTAQMAATAADAGVVDTALGRAQITRSSDGTTIKTTRSTYDELEAFPEGFGQAVPAVDGTGEIELDPDHLPKRVVSAEELRLDDAPGPVSGFRSKTDLKVTRLAKTKAVLGAPPPYPSSGVRADPNVHAQDRQASLERRSLGVTFQSVVSDVRLQGLLPKVGATEWIWHDAAWLELHPEEAQHLLDVAGKDLPIGGQAAAFDIVVIAGMPEGQAALARALTAWGARDDASYVILVQRIGYLRKPEGATLSFVEAEYARWRGTPRGRACAYTLGALAAAASNEPSQAARATVMVATLAEDLAKAKAVDEREARIRGLGNSGMPEAVPAILAQAKDGDVTIRLAVASALRRMDGDDVVDTLLALVTDPSADVASAALPSLFRQDLVDADWQALHVALVEHRIPKEAQDALVNGLAAHRGESPYVAAMLVAMAASDDVSPRVKARVETVLSGEK